MKTIITNQPHGTPNHCFGCGEANRFGLRLKFISETTQQGDPERVVARVRLARRFEGPPGYAHGGIIATLLDEAMSKANRQHGVVAMTRHMEIEYLRPVPLQKPVTLTGTRTSHEGRKNFCEATIANAEGNVLARGKAMFIAVDRDRLTSSSR